MKPFNRLCPQCQRPLTSNEMYCSWCNTYSPEARPNTTSTFPPPPPPYTDLPSQNWTQTGPMRDFPGEKLLSPQQPPRKKLNKLLLIGGILVVVCLLLAGSFWVGKTSGTSGNPSTTTTLPTSATTSSSQTGSTSVASTPSPQTTPTSAAPTSLPTASLKSPQLPLTISCISCAYPQLTVVLNSITVDRVGQSTNWVFAISNTGHNSCPSLSFTTLQLTDPFGKSYQAKGQAADSFAMGANQSLQVNAVFALLPTTGTQYTLKMDIYVGHCDFSTSSVSNPYQTENFTFA